MAMITVKKPNAQGGYDITSVPAGQAERARDKGYEPAKERDRQRFEDSIKDAQEKEQRRQAQRDRETPLYDNGKLVGYMNDRSGQFREIPTTYNWQGKVYTDEAELRKAQFDYTLNNTMQLEQRRMEAQQQASQRFSPRPKPAFSNPLDNYSMSVVPKEQPQKAVAPVQPYKGDIRVATEQEKKAIRNQWWRIPYLNLKRGFLGDESTDVSTQQAQEYAMIGAAVAVASPFDEAKLGWKFGGKALSKAKPIGQAALKVAGAAKGKTTAALKALDASLWGRLAKGAAFTYAGGKVAGAVEKPIDTAITTTPEMRELQKAQPEKYKESLRYVDTKVTDNPWYSWKGWLAWTSPTLAEISPEIRQREAKSAKEYWLAQGNSEQEAERLAKLSIGGYRQRGRQSTAELVGTGVGGEYFGQKMVGYAYKGATQAGKKVTTKVGAALAKRSSLWTIPAGVSEGIFSQRRQDVTFERKTNRLNYLYAGLGGGASTAIFNRGISSNLVKSVGADEAATGFKSPGFFKFKSKAWEVGGYALDLTEKPSDLVYAGLEKGVSKVTKRTPESPFIRRFKTNSLAFGVTGGSSPVFSISQSQSKTQQQSKSQSRSPTNILQQIAGITTPSDTPVGTPTDTPTDMPGRSPTETPSNTPTNNPTDAFNMVDNSVSNLNTGMNLNTAVNIPTITPQPRGLTPGIITPMSYTGFKRAGGNRWVNELDAAFGLFGSQKIGKSMPKLKAGKQKQAKQSKSRRQFKPGKILMDSVSLQPGVIATKSKRLKSSNVSNTRNTAKVLRGLGI